MRLFMALMVSLGCASTLAGQSPGRAAALSALVPGLGQRYVNGQQWNRSSAAYVMAESAFWAGVVVSEWYRGHAQESYRTWAVQEAGAHLDGKDRRFFVTIGQYQSSEEYRDALLRSRRWDQLSYVTDPAFHWQWTSPFAYGQYRALRQDEDAWGRRRTAFIVAAVGNRLVSALGALRAARRQRSDRVALRLTSDPNAVGFEIRVTLNSSRR